MKNTWGLLRRCVLGLSREETSYTRRGFRGATLQMRERLEQIGATFIGGYHAAVECGAPEKVGGALEAVDSELRGFAFEGVAMGLSLLDSLTPWGQNRLSVFLEVAARPHVYMAHVGLGWVWARLPLGLERARRRLDPLLAWLAFDGWGFHEGFFHWPDYLKAQPAPKRLTGYERRVFDQGLGRSFWFVNGGNPELVGEVIAGFPAGRQADLWSGIGLAAVYAGIVGEAELLSLRERAGVHWPALAQGATFASKARQRAANSTSYTEFAARVLCGLSAPAAAHLTDACLENLPANAAEPAYEIWRQRIQGHLAQSTRARAAAGRNS